MIANASFVWLWRQDDESETGVLQLHEILRHKYRQTVSPLPRPGMMVINKTSRQPDSKPRAVNRNAVGIWFGRARFNSSRMPLLCRYCGRNATNMIMYLPNQIPKLIPSAEFRRRRRRRRRSFRGSEIVRACFEWKTHNWFAGTRNITQAETKSAAMWRTH